MEDHIDAYWGSKKAWDEIPAKLSDMKHFTDWKKEIILDHGYDESKPESELTLEDVKAAAVFRGGECLSESMETGNKDPFFAQVWNPLHGEEEMREYPKSVSDLDV